MDEEEKCVMSGGEIKSCGLLWGVEEKGQGRRREKGNRGMRMAEPMKWEKFLTCFPAMAAIDLVSLLWLWSGR